MEQKNQNQPNRQAGQHQPQQGNQPGKQGQPGSKNEDFPGKAPDVYSDRNRDRSESSDAARKRGSHNEPSRRQ